MSEAVYSERDGAYVPSGYARGPWDPDAQHGGPPAALLARAFERLPSDGPVLVARMTVEFLGAVPMAPLTVRAEVVRPGRRLQLAEAEVEAEGRVVLRARAVRLRREAVEVPGRAIRPVRLAGPEGATPMDVPGRDALISAMEIRFLSGEFASPGAATAWFRLRLPLVETEDATPLQRLMVAADFNNGIGRELDFESHLFVNTDLTVHLSRSPVGEWFGLEARTDHGPEGTAMAWSTLHDADGEVGLSVQSLYVAAREAQ